MTTTRPTARGNRLAPAMGVTVALVLSAIVDLANLGGYLSGASIPLVVVGIWVALGVTALIAAGGTWSGTTWATKVAIAQAVITAPLGVTGAVIADNAAGKAVSGVGAVLSLVVIALVATRANRQAAD